MYVSESYAGPRLISLPKIFFKVASITGRQLGNIGTWH